jgi:transcriptional regulator with XRE-family HTH domain
MLTGKELGKAIAEAIRMKGVSQAAVARHFGVKPPSVSDWINRGTIDKGKLDDLFAFFRDVVGPEHWGRASIDEAHQPKVLSENLPATYNARPLVQAVCKLAEQIDDTGLRNLIDIAECLLRNHPLTKPKPPLCA